MTYLPISKLVAPLRKVLDRLGPLPDAPLGTLGAGVVASHYGRALLDAQPLYINIGALAIKSRGVPPTYHLRPSASRVVEETDLHSIPTEPPPMLRGPGIIEARRPETGERLWDDVVSLAWYQVEGHERTPPQLLATTFLLGLRWPDGIFAAGWSPAWTGEDLDDQLPRPDWGASLIESVDVYEHHRLARQAARFLVVLALLEQVEDGPLRFEIDKETKIRHVRPRDLSAKGMRLLPPAQRPEAQSSIDPSQRVLGETSVKGHLRRYRVGEGRSGIRWRYVHDYSSRRWFAPRFTVERDFSHTGLANSTLTFRGKR